MNAPDHEHDPLITPDANDAGVLPRKPTRRRLLWLGAASSLVGASLSGIAGYRLVAAQRSGDRDDDDLDDDVDLDDDDLQTDRDDDDLDDDTDLDDDDFHRDHDDDDQDDDVDLDDDDRHDDDDPERRRDREERMEAIRSATQLEAEVPADAPVVEMFNDDDYFPASLTIDVGEEVFFVNYDGDDHTATGAGFDTGIIREQGGVASVTFDTPGRFPFACQIHPEMVGEILVRDEEGNLPARATASPTAGGAEGAVTVQIANLAFSPATAQAATGETVTWTNDDSVPHTVTADDGSFDSGILDPGASFSRTFDQAGTFPYKCALHPQMQAEVVVGDGPVQR